MFCPNCGAKVPEGSAFCEACGARIAAEETPLTPPTAPPVPEYSAQPEASREKPSPNIELCPDGVYRWIYEYSMLKNPVILLTIWKVLGLACAIIAVFILLISLFQGDGFLEALKGAVLTPLLPLGILVVLSIPAYLIVAGQYGWKYIVCFEMDEKGVTHTQEPKQFTKAQGLAWLTAMVGAGVHSLPAAGAGLLVAGHQSTSTTFEFVRSVKVLRRWNTIKVNEPLTKNQVYAAPEDFDFVAQYILDRVPDKAKGKA